METSIKVENKDKFKKSYDNKELNKRKFADINSGFVTIGTN